MTRAELDTVMDPRIYTGRCAEQVERLIAEYEPLLQDAPRADAEISV